MVAAKATQSFLQSDTMMRACTATEGWEHVFIHGGSITLAFLLQLTMSFVYALPTSCEPNDLFQTCVRNVSEAFPLEVTMDWWSQIYDILTDAWSSIWLTYGMYGLCTRNLSGRLSCNPEIHSPVFYLTWIVITMARILKMFLWDRHYIMEATFVWWVIVVLSFSMLYVSYTNLHKHKAWLADNDPGVILCTSFLTQNGLAAFAWWSLWNATVGMGIVLKYKAGVPDPLVSTIVLTIMSLCIIIWFILQRFLCLKYMHFTFSPYPMLILCLGATFTRSYSFHHMPANTVFCGFLMLLITIMSCFHLVAECLHMDRPNRPLAIEPYMRFENCETVCKPAGVITEKPQK